jgi:hypothetical protein
MPIFALSDFNYTNKNFVWLSAVGKRKATFMLSLLFLNPYCFRQVSGFSSDPAF